MQPSADSTVMGEAATTRSGGLLPIHTKFAGESFDADSNVRIVYAGSPEGNGILVFYRCSQTKIRISSVSVEMFVMYS